MATNISQRARLGDLSRMLAYLDSQARSTQSRDKDLKSAFDAPSALQTLSRAAKVLPERYHSTYLDVLARTILQAQKAALEPKQMRELFADLLAPAQQVTDLRFASLDQHLKAHNALTSNLYQRFLHRFTTIDDISSVDNLDPLGYFILDQQTGPFTLLPDRTLPVTIIAKPLSLAQLPALWIIDGHEVAGHGVHALVPGFTQEFKQALADQLEDSLAKGLLKARMRRVPRAIARKVSAYKRPGERTLKPAVLRYLADAYAVELSADAIGTLNFGPAFAHCLCLYFSMRDNKHLKQDISSAFDTDLESDRHPPLALRYALALELMQQLDFAAQLAHCSLIDRRFGDQMEEEIDGSGSFVLFELLHQFAAVIAQTCTQYRFASLGDKTLSQVMTWSDRDETLAAKARAGDLLEAEARHVICAHLLDLCDRSEMSQSEREQAAQKVISILAGFYQEQCLICIEPRYRPSNFLLSDFAPKRVI